MKNLTKLLIVLPLLFSQVTLASCDKGGQDNNGGGNSSSQKISAIKNNGAGDYYKGIDFKLKGKDLRSSLSTLIFPHTELGYTPGLWNAYKTTDTNENNEILCIYTGLMFKYGKANGGQQIGSNYPKEAGKYYNREHSVPQSWYDGKKDSTEGCDIFNVYPTDAYTNGKRGNMDYGEVGDSTTLVSANGSKIGVSKRADNTATVFEVADEFKGDIARSYFYMVTCYMNESDWHTEGDGGSKVIKGNSLGVNLTQHGIDLMMKWSKNDPISQKEIDRNNAAFKLQGNRNPFIDYENLAYGIWTPSANYLSM